MAGIGKSWKKVFPKEIRKTDPVQSKIVDEGIKTFESMSPKMPAQSNEPVMPMADEEEIKRNKRRTAASRGGGRASTIFTDGDRLGP